MLKKSLSILLSLVLMLSLVPVTAFADDQISKEDFMACLTNTFQRLDSEFVTADKYTNTDSIVENLSKGAYEYTLGGSIAIDPFTADVKNSFKALPTVGKFLDTLSINVKPSADASNMKYEFNVYGDNEKLAINSPKVSRNYYYLNKADMDKWAESDVAKSLGVTKEAIEILKSYFEMLQFSKENIELYKTPAGLGDPYINLVQSYLSKGVLRSEGAKIVESGRGFINTQQYSFTISGATVERFKTDLATTLKEDKTLRGYFDSIYKDMPSPEGEGTMTDLVIEGLVEAINMVHLTDSLKYSIFVSNNGYIISHQFELPSDETGENINCFRIDTTGSQYLLDELKVFVGSVNSSTHEAVGIEVSAKGSHAMPDGVFNSKISGVMKIVAKNADGELKDNISNLFKGDIYYDATKAADNFKMSFNYDGMKLVIPGSIAIDRDNNTISADFNNIVASYLGETIKMNLNVGFAPIAAEKVKIPAGSTQVNIAELKQEDVDALTEKMEDAFNK